VKFKLGSINFDELKEANAQFNKNKTEKEPEKYYIVLAQAYVSKVQTHLLEEGADLDKTVSDIQKLSTSEKADTFYLCKSLDGNTAKSGEHWFAMRNPEKLIYLALVCFSTDEDMIECSGCGKAKLEMKFCHNDGKYFCNTCDDDFHNKTNYQTLRKHKRTNYMSFSVTYQGTCNNHSLKPLEFYCTKCKAVYCIKCLTDGDHTNNPDHEVKYLNEIFNSFDHQSKTFIEKVKQINSEIASELEEKEKNAK
jgi:hypothetical protein